MIDHDLEIAPHRSGPSQLKVEASQKLSCLSHMTVIAVICAGAAGPVSAQSQVSEAPRPTIGGALRMSAGRVSEGPSAENWRDPLVWGEAEVIAPHRSGPSQLKVEASQKLSCLSHMTVIAVICAGDGRARFCAKPGV